MTETATSLEVITFTTPVSRISHMENNCAAIKTAPWTSRVDPSMWYGQGRLVVPSDVLPESLNQDKKLDGAIDIELLTIDLKSPPNDFPSNRYIYVAKMNRSWWEPNPIPVGVTIVYFRGNKQVQGVISDFCAHNTQAPEQIRRMQEQLDETYVAYQIAGIKFK